MSRFLDTIIAHKQEEVRALRSRRADFRGRTSPRRDFAGALRKAPELAVIAEVKKASPSKGVISADFDPVAIARNYQESGASAVSVLTDRKFFQGAEEYLVDIRERIELPVLRKDFIIDPLQVEQTASIGADAMLLIAASLSDAQMEELYSAAEELDIEPLIEVHSTGELDRVMKLSPKLLGVNNRDLTTFAVDLGTTVAIAPHLPDNVTVVSESGIFKAEDARKVSEAGVHAILVGEALMRSTDTKALIAELGHAGED